MEWHISDRPVHESGVFAYSGRLPVEENPCVEYFRNVLRVDVVHEGKTLRKGTEIATIIVTNDAILGYDEGKILFRCDKK